MKRLLLALPVLLIAGLLALFLLPLGGGRSASTFTNVSNGLGGAAPAVGADSSGSGGADGSGSSGQAPYAAPSAPAAPGDSTAPTGTKGQLAVDLGKPSGKIERTVHAAYTVPSGHFVDSMQALFHSTTDLGGYVVSSQTSPDAGQRVVSGTFQVKVPADKLTTLLHGFSSDWSLSSVDFATVDHTADFRDVSLRLHQATVQRDVLTAALQKATDPAVIADLQRQVTALQDQIDAAQGQLNVVDEAVTLSTATIALTERGTVAVSPPSPLWTALHQGLDNAVVVLAVALGVLLTLLPFLPVVVALWLLRRRIGRGLRRMFGMPPATPTTRTVGAAAE